VGGLTAAAKPNGGAEVVAVRPQQSTLPSNTLESQLQPLCASRGRPCADGAAGRDRLQRKWLILILPLDLHRY